MTPDEKIYAVFEDIRFLTTGEVTNINNILKKVKAIQKTKNRKA